MPVLARVRKGTSRERRGSKDSEVTGAISFISEAIKSQPLTDSDQQPPTKRLKVSSSGDRTDLAARQKALEAHIEETKTLMAQLSLAKTKSDKDKILATLRERNRLVLYSHS